MTRAMLRMRFVRRPANMISLIHETTSTVIALGGDHGVPIPVMRALEIFDVPITLVHAERLICNFNDAAVRAGYYEG